MISSAITKGAEPISTSESVFTKNVDAKGTVTYTPKPEYKDINKAQQIIKDAEVIRAAIRREKILDHPRFSESHCAENVSSELCKSVDWLRRLLDRKDTSPLPSATPSSLRTRSFASSSIPTT